MDKAGNTYMIGQFTGTANFDPGTTVTNLFSGPGTNTYLLRLSTAGLLRGHEPRNRIPQSNWPA